MINSLKTFSFIIAMHLFIGCRNGGDRFIGKYALDKYSDKPVISIVHNAKDIYIAKPLFRSNRKYIFKYNSNLKILISGDKDSMSLVGNELNFTNENGSKFFYKLK
jgi:hypothetical protein